MNFHNHQFCSDIANLVNSELKERRLAVRDLAKRVAGPLGLTPSTIGTYIHELRKGWIIYAHGPTNTIRIRQHEKLAAILFVLGVPDEHPVISALKSQDETFQYPPQNRDVYEVIPKPAE